jgi:hypothetical protein
VRFGLLIRTVTYWLRQIRSQWKTAATQYGAELAALGLACLNGIYCKVMGAWRKAQTELHPLVQLESRAIGGDRAVRGRGVPPGCQKRRDAASTSAKANRRETASTSSKASRRSRSSNAILGRAITAVRESLKFLKDSARAPATLLTDDRQKTTDKSRSLLVIAKTWSTFVRFRKITTFIAFHCPITTDSCHALQRHALRARNARHAVLPVFLHNIVKRVNNLPSPHEGEQ